MHASTYDKHACLQPCGDHGTIFIQGGDLHRLRPDGHTGFVEHPDSTGLAILAQGAGRLLDDLPAPLRPTLDSFARDPKTQSGLDLRPDFAGKLVAGQQSAHSLRYNLERANWLFCWHDRSAGSKKRTVLVSLRIIPVMFW